MADTVTVSDKQPAPSIRRESVTIDGQQVEQIRGDVQDVHLRLPPGTVVGVVVTANGLPVASLGPWTAQARPGRDAGADVRLRVFDDLKPAKEGG